MTTTMMNEDKIWHTISAIWGHKKLIFEDFMYLRGAGPTVLKAAFIIMIYTMF